jgi:lysozyme
VIPSEWLYTFIKRKEIFSQHAYHDGGGFSVGYGHHTNVKEGDTCTIAQADEWLHQDVTTAVNAVNREVKVPLTQQQYDALVDFVYNVGIGAFHTSTVLRLLNEKDYEGAAHAMLRYVNANGRENPTLVARRHEEVDHFLGDA